MDLKKNGQQKRGPSVKAVFWISIVLTVVMVVMLALLMFNYSNPLAAAFIVVLFIFALINKGYWKCPACGKHLGRFGRISKCSECGAEWDM